MHEHEFGIPQHKSPGGQPGVLFFLVVYVYTTIVREHSIILWERITPRKQRKNSKNNGNGHVVLFVIHAFTVFSTIDDPYVQ